MRSDEIEFRNENNNSAKNFNSFKIGNIRFYFSYETLVAFVHPTHGMVVLENYWGPTTGKHLNWLAVDKKDRKTNEEFEALLADIEINVRTPTAVQPMNEDAGIDEAFENRTFVEEEY